MESTKSPEDTLYTIEFTFHRATHVPVADFPHFSADPYIDAYLSVPAHPKYGDDNPLAFRTPTVRSNLNPVWDSKWRVAGIPTSGFKLVIRLRDEDPGDHDDRLGSLTIRESEINESLERNEQEYEIKKSRGSIQAYVLTYIGSAVSKKITTHPRLIASIKVIGRTPDQKDRRVYTVGPHWWSVHYSPIIGKLTGIKGPDVSDEENPDKAPSSVSVFQANKLQLGGPVPAELKHQYVGYRPFITWLFTRRGVRGRLIHWGLHRQYCFVYYYNKTTEYGVLGVADEPASPSSTKNDAKDDNNNESPHPGPSSSSSPSTHQTEEEERILEKNIASRFLEMTHWGEGGRLFTYIITLDGEWRFTETGEEFAIDMLSKHSMHSDIAPEIAYSGEFFVQRREGCDADGNPLKEGEEGGGDAGPASRSDASGTAVSIRPRNPKCYELVIDNDSGTYRPKKELLPIFQSWLESPRCLGGLGSVRAMDGFDESLKEMKKKRKEIKAECSGKKGKSRPVERLVQVPSSLSSGTARRLGRSGSMSSSDIDELVDSAKKAEEKNKEDETGGSKKEEVHSSPESENKSTPNESTVSA